MHLLAEVPKVGFICNATPILVFPQQCFNDGAFIIVLLVIIPGQCRTVNASRQSLNNDVLNDFVSNVASVSIVSTV